MDGRLNLPLIANIPMGVIQPFRNIGGKFDLGSPLLNDLLREVRHRALEEGSRMLVMFTYHYSRGDVHRGCAGHNYDTQAAFHGAKDLKKKLRDIFGRDNETISTIVVGVETDEDALIFHDGDNEIAIRDYVELSNEEMEAKIAALYSWMNPEILRDLLPIAMGNRDHVRDMRQQQRPIIDCEHRENIIAVGRGFDWLHLPNRALIIGPYDYDWGAAVRVAGGLVSGNLEAERASQKDGALLLVSAPFFVPSDRALVAEKSRYLAGIVERVLRESWPTLPFEVLVGVTDSRTWRMSGV